MDDIYTNIGDTEVLIRVTYFHAGYPATSGPDAEEAIPPYVEFKVLKDGDECQISEGEKERLYDFVLDYCLNYEVSHRYKTSRTLAVGDFICAGY